MALIVGLAILSAGASAFAAESESSIARGARLYDKWFAENKSSTPATDHPAYPVKGGKYGKDASWRLQGMPWLGLPGQGRRLCQGRPCHGHQGHSGRCGKDPAAIAALLRDKTHGYTDAQISARDAADLGLFVSKGQVDMVRFVDGGKAKGSAAKGEVYFTHPVRRLPRGRRQEAQGRAAAGVGG